MQIAMCTAMNSRKTVKLTMNPVYQLIGVQQNECSLPRSLAIFVPALATLHLVLKSFCFVSKALINLLKLIFYLRINIKTAIIKALSIVNQFPQGIQKNFHVNSA